MFSAKIKFQRKSFLLDADINLDAGYIMALVGPSGSGKTSFMRLIAGLEKPQSGLICSGKRLLFCDDKRISIPPQKRKVGLMFQDYALFNHMNIADNIAYGIEKSNRESVVKFWLQRINLTHRAKDFPDMLSGGEKQRVALARVLACEPEILLLDEPFSALDTLLRHELRREIQTLIKDSGIPVLIATHDLEEARLIADQVCIMVKGKVLRKGKVSDVFRNPGSIAAARALGWQNILPVTNSKGEYVFGPWGKLKLFQIPRKEVLAIGIPPANINLQCQQNEVNNIPAKILHVVALDDYQILELKLKDNTNLVFEQKDLSQKVTVNQTINIGFDSQKIKIFYQ